MDYVCYVTRVYSGRRRYQNLIRLRGFFVLFEQPDREVNT
jgi:hypothetical protein